MKIKSLSVRGFRGFNDTREITFGDKLTLIAAHNSYGKTSISEAFEWLLYGQTSKVENANSKDEYKGSYRNVHLPNGQDAVVSLALKDGGREVVLRATLSDTGTVTRYVNDQRVENWPFEQQRKGMAKPFILQHALKDLLLATPADRFASFTELLGFEELGQVQKEIVAFCTKPNSPREVLLLQNEIADLQSRLNESTLTDIAKALKKADLTRLFELVCAEARRHLPLDTPDDSLHLQIAAKRDEAVAQIFKGSVAPRAEQVQPGEEFDKQSASVLGTLSSEFIARYIALVASKEQQKVLSLAEFFGLGIQLLKDSPTHCPLCSQPIAEPIRVHIVRTHSEMAAQREKLLNIDSERKSVRESLLGLLDRLRKLLKIQTNRISNIAALEDTDLKQLDSLLVNQERQLKVVRDAVITLKETRANAAERVDTCSPLFDEVIKSIDESSESAEIISRLSKAVVEAVASVNSLRELINENAGPLQEAESAIKLMLDSLAGTKDLSLLVELFQMRNDIEKKFKVQAVLDGLKVIRTNAEQYVGQRMLDSVSGDFGSDVMAWYDKIRTTGDPKVHFAGFDLKKTAQGNRVQIKAASYGKELVSAVSSLSESKLNALGLCMSIAINLKNNDIFDFLIVDDPIQSWDAEHEEQFINVIRELILNGKQVVILSHNYAWITRVRIGCEDIGGVYYEISSFDRCGPSIDERDWATVEQRLATISGIANNPNADIVALQQAEQEFRHVVTQLAAALKHKVLGVRVSTANLNAHATKKILLECNVGLQFVNKIMSAFATINESHHEVAQYTINRERIRQYLDWANTLREQVANAESQ